MFGYGSTIATSLQLMLKIIINYHFQDATCIVQLNTSPFYDFSLSSVNQLIPQYVNPKQCTSACKNYILFDPLRNNEVDRLNTCFMLQTDYQFQGIILLDHDTIDNYIFSNVTETVPSFAGNSIFVSRKNDQFVIEAFDHWYADTHVVLNRWNIIKENFENESIDEFFSDQRRKRYIGEIELDRYEDMVPFFIESIEKGSELLLMVEFAKQMNMKYEFSNLKKPTTVQVTKSFVLGDYGVPLFKHAMGVYPVSPRDITFLVPKPRQYISPMTLFNVLSIELWLLISASYILFAIEFWIENIFSNDLCPTFANVIGMFLFQGLDEQNMPLYFRGRFVVALMLILTLLYSSLFSSGIVDKMMMPSYEGDVNTIEDLAESNYTAYCTDYLFRIRTDHDYKYDVAGNPSLSESEKRVFLGFKFESDWHSNLERFALNHAITQSKLSMLLTPSYELDRKVNWSIVKTMDDYFFYKSYSNIQLSFMYNHYMLLLPFLAKHLSICKGAGLMLKWEMDAFRAKVPIKTIMTALDVKPPPSEPSVLQFEHIRGVLIVWIAGLATATLIFSTERLWALHTYEFYF